MPIMRDDTDCAATSAASESRGENAASLKTLKQRRAMIKSQCTRFRTYVDTVDVQNTSIIELRARLQRFATNWEEFNGIQSNIEALDTGDQAEANHEEERTSFEDRYFAITTALETLIDEKLLAAQPPHTFQSLRHTREDTPMIQGTSLANDCLKLPRITLPTFSGKYDEWTSFRNMFHSMIGLNASLPDVQKMQYLISAVKGEAYDVISSLEASAENYKEAWQMLNERYDDPGFIVGKHIKALFDLPSMSRDNHIILRKLLDTVLKHLRALKALKRPTDQWDDLMLHLVTTRLDQATSREWEASIERGKVPSFNQLITFLNQRCRALEASGRAQRPTIPIPSFEKSSQNRGTTAHLATAKNICAYCQGENHSMYKCKDFLALGIEQRVKEVKARRMCLNCLRSSTHQAKECSAGACRKCNRRHNTLIHVEQSSRSYPDTTSNVAESNNEEKTKSTSVSCASVNQVQQVLLATALVSVLDAKGKFRTVRALLDNGSQSCFITSDCCNDLGLKQHATCVPICGLGKQPMRARKLTKITMHSRVTGYKRSIDCLVIEKITQDLPSSKIYSNNLQIPNDISLADPQFDRPSKIDLLLGAGIFFDLLCVGKIKLSKNQPTWQNTLLGWIVSGSLMDSSQSALVTVCNLAINDQLNANLVKFWQIEGCDRKDTRTPEERVCESHFTQTYKRRQDGRFVISLPIKENVIKQLGDSKEIAIQRLKGLERRFLRDPQLKAEYTRFMHEYLELGHMRELQSTVNDVWPHFYMPHHCVIKEASITTKLRVVFDASSKTTTGISLNDALMVGPVLQQESVSILLRFRSYKYVLTADTEKMYRQIFVHEKQTSLQRIVWRDNPTDNIRTYELLTLTYGTAPASFIATKVIQQLAELEAHRFPKGAVAARKEFYVDDFISGANTKEEAIETRNQVTALLEEGGFKLRKWASNNKELLDGIQSSSSRNQLLELDRYGAAKTLGINWRPADDTFQYRIRIEASNSKTYTKRAILSQIAQIFDPLGLLGPVVTKAKILMQRLWKSQVDWDEPLPPDIATDWISYIKDLQDVEKISIPRKIISEANSQDGRIEMHGFSDASESAYGACIYLRSFTCEGMPEVHLVCSKSRVAPLKVLSIPRLELCGAQLLVQLAEKTRKSLEIQFSKEYYWTDSLIVLHWIRAANKKLPVFVAHRVGEIQDATAVDDWRHVEGKENPADLISRGACVKDLVKSQIWWGGPHWLHEEIIPEKSFKQTNFDEAQLEVQDIKVTAVSICEEVNSFAKFSKFITMIRIATTCLRFIHNCKERKLCGPLTVDELEEAEKRLVRREQEIAFPKELKALKNGKTVPCQSRLKHLNPFMDKDNLIRVGGRLRYAELSTDVKHSILLPQRSRFTELLIEHEHRRSMHAGVDATLAAVRQKYWPIRARGTTRKLLRSCIKCFRSKPRFSEQLMGNLPIHRVTASRPFSSTGVDFCGPIHIREGSRRNSKRVKAYVALFVCMATKATHLEIVSNMTTDAFLNAFKRFIGRRGKPSDVFSDNGTNFVGASRELEDLRALFNEEEHQRKIIDEAAVERIKWHFIPPRAPHFGGLWEATVKAFKNHFYKIVNETPLSFEEASTLITQIEAILNSRPLIALSSDPNDMSYISAGHFLIGDTLTAYPEPDLRLVQTNRLSRWQHLEQMRQHFWRRWSNDYLLQLQRRAKWQSNRGPPIQIGQLVICREDGLPPLKWVLGRIQEVFPGDDNIVRTAIIKTTSGLFKRPASRLAILPVETNANNVSE